jgi:hypothetical protein
VPQSAIPPTCLPRTDDPANTGTISVGHNIDTAIDLSDGAHTVLAIVSPDVSGFDRTTGETRAA